MSFRRIIYKIRYRHVFKRFKGILLLGQTLYSIDKNAVINIRGLMKFNEKGSNSHGKNYEIGRIHIDEKATLICGYGVSFYAGCKLSVHDGAKLVIGNDCFFNMNTTLYCRNHITIGNETYISQNVVIRDSDGHKIVNSVVTAPIKIGNHCWIGTNAIILKGVTIGDNSVIGAGSVVTHDIPPNSVAAGNPAKVIKYNIEWK